jgi:hypothetical protein
MLSESFFIYSECHYADCRYAECRHAQCRGALINCLTKNVAIAFCCKRDSTLSLKMSNETCITS